MLTGFTNDDSGCGQSYLACICIYIRICMTMYVYLYMCPYLYFVQSVSVTGYTDDDSGQSCLPWDLGRRLALALASHFHRKSPLHFAQYTNTDTNTDTYTDIHTNTDIYKVDRRLALALAGHFHRKSLLQCATTPTLSYLVTLFCHFYFVVPCDTFGYF